MRWDMLKLEMNYCFTQGSKIKFTSICLFLKENSRATKMQRMLSEQTRKKKTNEKKNLLFLKASLVCKYSNS